MIAPLFDELIGRTAALTASAAPLPFGEWPDAGRQNLVLRSEMAFELGRGFLAVRLEIFFVTESVLDI